MPQLCWEIKGRNGPCFHQFLLKWFHFAAKLCQRKRASYEHGAVSLWLEQGPGKQRRKCSSWVNLVNPGSPMVSGTQSLNSAIAHVSAYNGRRQAVASLLDSHCMLGSRVDSQGWTGNSPREA